MKKLFAVMLMLAIVISLAACGESGSQNPNAQADSAQETVGSIMGQTEEIWVVMSETETTSSGSVYTKEYSYNSDGSYSMDYNVDGYYEYDAMGNMLLHRAGNSVRICVYDENGNLLRDGHGEDGMDSRKEYVYDDMGNCIKETAYAEDGTVAVVTTYEYDANGNMIRMEKVRNGVSYVEEFTYSEYNDVTSEKRYSSGELTDVFVYEYTYDDAGNMLTMQHPRNGGSGYYIWKNVYNEQGLLISEKRGTELSDSCDRNILYEYDENGRLVYQRNMHSNDHTESERYYEYDENGNLIYEKFTYENNSTGKNNDQYEEWFYTYDEYGHLIELVNFNNYNDREYTGRTVWVYELITITR